MPEPMRRGGEETPADRLTRLEASVLEQLANLHPNRLSTDELALSMGSRCERTAFDDAVAGLCCAGLIRRDGDIVEMTYAAICAHELLTL